MSHDLGILDITQNCSHQKDHIPIMESNGWVMWNMGTFNDPWNIVIVSEQGWTVPI